VRSADQHMSSQKSVSLKRLGLMLSAFTAALFNSAVFAHHSFAMFDSQSVVVLRGTMIKFSYLNPHSWISVMGAVGSDSEGVRYDIEATSPSSLKSIGIQADTLKPGDNVTIAFHPLRDGRRGGSLVFVVTPDGIAHGAKPGDLGFDLATLKPAPQ
jgi:hypothetical protein